jgi:hypothetical protein
MIAKFYKPLALGALLLGISTAGLAQTGEPVEKQKANSDYKPRLPPAKPASAALKHKRLIKTKLLLPT